MATIVIVSVSADDLALSETLDRLPEAEFESERIIKSGEDAVMPLMWARNVDREELEEVLQDDSSVDNINLLADFDEEYLYRMDWIDRIDLLLQMITSSEATILDAYGQGTEWRFRVMFPTRDKFSMTHDFCEEHGVNIDVQAIRDMDAEPSGRYGLTGGQYEALVSAVRNGYYEVPQEQTLEELAEEFDVSHQALSERLRRGTKALIEDTLMVGAPPEFS